jgi:very-short-patch-repair endonuclease
LLAESSTTAETEWLKWLHKRGYRLPTHAQYRVEDAVAKPDFVYADRDMRVAIYVDGPVHSYGDVQTRDGQAEARLFSKGWLVRRFRTDDRAGWDRTCLDLPDVFGQGDTL